MNGLSNTFAALGDGTRFAIVERLLREGELTAGNLNEDFDISGPAISRHLKVLRESGIIQQKIDGQKRLYSVRPQSIEAITAWTMSHREFWQASLNRLDKALTMEIEQK